MFNWNNWVQLKILTVKLTQTWYIFLPPPTSGNHYTSRDQNNHLFPSTGPPPCYKFIFRYFQYIHHYESLHQCHYTLSFRYLVTYTYIPLMLILPYPLHAPPIGNKMVNLLQCHSTVLCITQMRVDGGYHCRDFWYKHLFYVLFVCTNYFQVSGGSTFSAARVYMLPIKFPQS